MSAHELPDLPSLPPLTLPSYCESTLAPPPPLSPGSSFHLQQSPALSIAESFSTAYTSTSPGEELPETSHLGPSSLAPPQSLRKSLSVDSFAQYSRESSKNRSNESAEPNRKLMYGLTVNTQAEPTIPIFHPRSRGESLSFLRQDHEPSFPPDPDVDRYDLLNHAALEHSRRLSLKTQDPSNASLRGGDLPLPSRTHASPTITTTTTAPNHSALGESRSISSTTSLQSSSSKVLKALPAGRLRSGSLGYNFPSSSKRNTYVAPSNRPFDPSTKRDIVIAVIGIAGCGKSTLIRKGLSGYGLVESSAILEASSSDERPRYIRRTGSVILDDQLSASTSGIIEVIEVDIQTTNSGLLEWPQGLPPVDGIIICYDASSRSSYQPVEGLLKGYRSTAMPVMVLGCKSERPHEIDPMNVMAMLKRYDTGLIEVSNAHEAGKERMKQSFAYLLKAVLRQWGYSPVVDDRNPASPVFLNKGSPLGDSWTHSPISPTSIPTFNAPSSMTLATDASDSSERSASTPTADSVSPISPHGQPSAGDLLHTVEMSKIMHDDSQDIDVPDSDDVHHQDSGENSPSVHEGGQPHSEGKKVKKEPRPSQWADLDDLLDKLLFLSVSGDDPTFATHFLLTYRRFTTPRSVLLAMQKRMRQLDNPSGDPMFACFAQMRICHLLETWIHDYPHDFAVKGTAGALNALIKSIISKTHLLHYGSEFLPFLEQLPGLVDEDSTWALKVEADADSDDYIPEDEEDEETKLDENNSVVETTIVEASTSSPPKATPPSRERKVSLPLSKALSTSQTNGHQTPFNYDQNPKHYIRDLVKLAVDVLNTDSDEIAQEITRQGEKRFMVIRPRDWLYFTFVAKKHPEEPITIFNLMSNHLADWVVSLILCHERPRNRARQIEKFVDIGVRLRNMNNYSALRAFVAGINNANDDLTMEQFKSKSPDLDKLLRSWDVLLQQVRAHRSYRLALRNSKGACIPAMEVHISDLIKSHEGNEDTNPEYPSKIHWGKFNMIGRFITTTIQCQNQCRNSTEYNFHEHPQVSELLNRRPVMSIEMQKSRLKSQDDNEDIQPIIPTSPPINMTGMRRIFFW